MANQYSYQASKALITNPYTVRKELLAIDYYGRKRLSRFAFVTESAAPTSGGVNSDSTHLPQGATVNDGGYGPVNIADTVLLCKIPAQAIITGGFIAFGAFGTGATAGLGTATVDGQGNVTVVSATAFLGQTSVAAVGTANFANTLALGYGTILAQDTWLILTAAGANFTNQIALAGHIDWTLD